MSTIGDFPLDRRQFVLAAGASLLAGCGSCPERLTLAIDPRPAPLGDAHVHFFNLADLPARGFVRHVLLPERKPGLPPIAAAIVDFFVMVLKPLAPTIRAERRGLYLSLIEDIPDRHVSAGRYADLLASRIERQARTSAANPRRGGNPGAAWARAEGESVADSYFALGVLLNSLDLAKAFDSGAIVDADPGTFDRQEFERAIRVDRSFLERVAEGDWDAEVVAARARAFAPPPPNASADACPTREDSEPWMAEELLQLLQWGLEMLQSRCSHVRKFIERNRTADHEPTLMVNLLVDYDRWLGDGPSRGSRHDAQIKFWHDFSTAFREQVAVRTFAAFCPLKLAEERLLGRRGRPTQFDRLKACYLNRGGDDAETACHGFKVYPPMGFQPVGNALLDFDGDERAQKIVGDRWRLNPILGRHRVGEEIDKALDAFFDFCIASRAPVMTHAGPGNSAACGYGQRAHPRHWLELVSRPHRRALRLCIGHMVDDAQKFIDGVADWRSGRPVSPDVWALHGTQDMLLRSQAGDADVYADVSFLSDLLKGSDADQLRFSVSFFSALKLYCNAFDPECRRILFGTDWIMLGHKLNYRRYVAVMEHGIREAGWPEEWKTNFFHDNLARFLESSAAAEALPRPRGVCRSG